MPTKVPKQIMNLISASLPRWALVAAAVQCAKRVEPIFSSDWSCATQSQILAVRKSITLAQQSVADATSIIASAKTNAQITIDSAKAASATSAQSQSAARSAKASGAQRAAFAAYAAKAAAGTVHFVLWAVALDAVANNAARAGDESSAKGFIGEAFKAELGAKKCAISAFAAAIDADNSIQDSLTRDLESLADAVRQNSWSDETPIPTDFFARRSAPTQDFLKIKCPKCGKALRASVEMRGKKGRCAHCMIVFQIGPVRSAPTPSPRTKRPSSTDTQRYYPPIDNPDALIDDLGWKHKPIEEIEKLIQRHGLANVATATNSYGFGAIHAIAGRSDLSTSLLERFLDFGIDVNTQTPNGTTALNCAAGFDSGLAAAKLLVNRGANIDQIGGGVPPIGGAASYSSIEMVRFLISAGANVNLKDSQGFRPLDRAKLSNAASNKKETVIKILKAAGAIEG